MEPTDRTLRDRLLSEMPKPDDIAGYRQQVSTSIDSQHRRLRRERIWTASFWIFAAVSATAWLWFDAGAAHFPRGPFLACIFFTWAGVELLKHYMNATRVELLKEVKQLQLQVFTMQAALRADPAPPRN